MGILSRLFGTLRSTLYLSGSYTPPDRSAHAILKAYNNNPELFAVASRVAYDVASNELIVWNTKNADDWQRVHDHPILDIVDRAPFGMTRTDNLALYILYRDLIGEGAFIKVLSLTGRLHHLEILNPVWIEKLPANAEDVFKVRPPDGGTAMTFGVDELIYTKRPNPVDPFGRGRGYGQALADELQISEISDKLIQKRLTNGGLGELIVSTSGLVAGTESSPEALLSQMQQTRAGIHEKIHVLNDMDASVQELSPSFSELQISEIKSAVRRIIQQTWGIPPEMLGDVQNSNRATINTAAALYGRNTLLPRLDALCQMLTEVVKNDLGEENIVVGYASPIPDDYERALKVMSVMPDGFKVDEWRAVAEHDPLPDDDGQVHMLRPTSMPVVNLRDELDWLNDPPAGAEKAATANKGIGVNTEAAVMAAIDKHDMTSSLLPIIADCVQKFGSDMVESVDAKAAKGFDFASPTIAQFLREKAGERIRGIGETTKKQLRQLFLRAELEAWTIDQIAGAVGGLFKTADQSRSWAIARTETVKAAAFGSLEGMKQAGVAKKEWLATRDGRTRGENPEDLDDHIYLDERPPIPVNDPFISDDGDEAQHPGDFGVAGMDINCRCAVLPVVGSKSVYDTIVKRTKRFRQHDRARARFEARLRRAVRAAFRKQRDEVIKELKK